MIWSPLAALTVKLNGVLDVAVPWIRMNLPAVPGPAEGKVIVGPELALFTKKSCVKSLFEMTAPFVSTALL